MELRTILYLLVALLYIAYPLYCFTAYRQTGAMRRTIALGLMVYGGLLLYWPRLDELFHRFAERYPLAIYEPQVPVVLGSLLVIGGFGWYRGILEQKLLWLAGMAYALMVIHWPGMEDLLATLVAIFVLVIGLDRCLQHRTLPASPEGHHE